MGLLSFGTPLEWNESKKWSDYIKREGIKQFLRAFHLSTPQGYECLSWGDEIEYLLIKVDKEQKRAYLSIRGEQIIEETNILPETVGIWHPEYAKFMLESTPLQPYSRKFIDLLQVERNMRRRRGEVEARLRIDERLISIPNFPLLGHFDGFDWSLMEISNDISLSKYIPDQVISSHARFKTLTRNIRHRRGSKVDIKIPVFNDSKTDPFISTRTMGIFEGESIQDCRAEIEYMNKIHMDCMCFGMGCCCLQMTIQACNIEEARYIYDQLAIISPIMLALSAGSPIYRGILSDIDCRWQVIEGSVDDRSLQERDIAPLTIDHPLKIKKSRYSSVSQFIGLPSMGFLPEYNDLDCPLDLNSLDALLKGGVDECLAKHFAHLFIRDPLVVYSEMIELTEQDNESMDHFENIQSTNWQTCRFKPPSLSDKRLGWRVEFRPMEVQLNDHQNASLVIFVYLFVRMMIHLRINLYLPISLVDENMKRGQRRDAVVGEKFYFSIRASKGSADNNSIISLLSIDQIVNGEESIKFMGLAGMIREYLEAMEVEEVVKLKLLEHVKFVQDRANGSIKTNARLIRDFVTNHPDYKANSVVSPLINYDLMEHLSSLSK